MRNRALRLSLTFFVLSVLLPVHVDLAPAPVESAPAVQADSKKCRKVQRDYDRNPTPKNFQRLVNRGCSTQGLQAPTLQSGSTFTVNSNTDELDARPGDGVCETSRNNRICTLRAAVMEANARNGQDTIVLPSGTFTFTRQDRNEIEARSGDLNITDHLVITGAGAQQTTVDAASVDRVFEIRNRRTVRMTGLTITGGRLPAGSGAGIYSDGDLTLDDVVIRLNKITAGDGAGIYADGPLRIARSSVVENSTDSGFGGGLATANAVTLSDVLVRGNSAAGFDGGGLFSIGAPVNITSSTFESNAASGRDGGAIRATSAMTLSSSTFNGNRSGRDGGALFLGGTGESTLTNVTIHANQASARGGGIWTDSNAVVRNTTISSNTATNQGGGIYRYAGTLSLTNTLLADNPAGGNAHDNCSGGVNSATNNLDSGTTCGFGSGNLTSTAPRLGALAQNGGPTLTQLPQAGSPAIDAGTGSGCPGADQRGRPRPVDGNSDGQSACDIGATEADAGTTGGVAPTSTPTPQTQAAPTATPTIVPVQQTKFAPGVQCGSFANQRDAQAFLRQFPSDPLNIDSSRNGIACEGQDGAGFVNFPTDVTPVPRP